MFFGGPVFLVLLGGAGFLLGHVAFEAGVRERSPARFVPTAEKGFVKLAFGYLIAGWVGIVLAEAGVFSAGALFGCVAGLAVLVVAITWRRQRVTLMRFGLDFDYSPAVIVFLVAIGLYFYLPAFEIHLDGRDFSVYQLSGAHIARHGSLAIDDQLVAELDPEAKDFFVPGWREADSRIRPRFMGFYLASPDSGRVLPQFMPLFTVWVAVGYLVGGVQGGLWAAPLLALFSASAFFYLGRRLVHTAVGIGAAVLLAANFVQIWFTRSGAAELAAQSVVLIGCYGLALQRRHRDPFFGLLTSIAFGLAWFAKAELVVLMVPMLVLLVTDLCRERVDLTAWWTMWVPLAALVAHLLVHARGWSWPYFQHMLLVVGIRPTQLLGASLAALLALMGVVIATRRWPDSRRRRSNRFLQGDNRTGRAFRWVLSVATLVLAAYAYWLRPTSGPGTWSRFTVVELSWIVSPVALALAVLGAVLYLHDRQAQRGSGAIFGILLSMAVVPLAARFVMPYVFWAYRRFVPFVLPTTILLCTYAWWRIWESGPGWLATLRRRWRGADQEEGRVAGLGAGERVPLRVLVVVVLVAIGIVILGHTLTMANRYAPHQEMAGAVHFVALLDAALEPESLLLFEPPTRYALHRLEAPLALLTDRDVLRLSSVRVDPSLLQTIVRDQTRKQRAVYLVTSGRVQHFPFPRAEPFDRFVFRSVVMEEKRFMLPNRARDDLLDVHVYRLLVGGNNRSLPGGLDVGNWDDIYVDGFHAAEVDHRGVTFRWTRERVGVSLPGLAPGEGQLQLVLGVGEDYPEALDVPTVELSLDGVPMGSISVDRGWATYTVPLPSSWKPVAGGTPYLALEAPTWRPSDFFEGNDTRQLGVKVDLIAWSEDFLAEIDEADRPDSLP